MMLLSLLLLSCGESSDKKKEETEKPIADYTIVYPDCMGTYVEEFTEEKYAALRLQDMIYDAHGVKLEAVSDITEKTGKEILIGDARNGENSCGDNSYSISSEKEGVRISAKGIYAYTAAFDAFMDSLDTKTADIPKELKLSKENVMTGDKDKDYVYLDLAEGADPPKEIAIKKLTVMGNDISKYKIIYHEWGDLRNPHYGLNEAYAAEQLQMYIKLITGIELPIETDESKPSEYEIIMGITNREGDTIKEIDRSGYGEEATLIKTEGNHLIITGAQRRGTIYAAYTFLEQYLGVRFYTADCETVFKSDGIDIAEDTYDEHIPTMEFRDIYNKTMHENEYSSKRKVNSNNNRVMNYKQGGNFNYAGDFVHTMGTILELENAPGAQQPCFTDEETYQKALTNVRTILKRKPDSKFISVTQNDAYMYCGCADCKKLITQEGCTGGALFHFINRLADDIKDEFPDVKIMTLAYMFSIDPPKTAPRDNVVIMFCPIDSCCGCTLNDPECPKNQSFAKQYKGWMELTDNIYVWYYVKECIDDGMLPFMNFDAMYYNYCDFNEDGVKGVFNEALSISYGGEFGALRSYLLSLLMWDQDMTYEEYTAELHNFIDAYYGEASEVVEEYFNLLSECAEGKHFTQYASVNALYNTSYLSDLLPQIDNWMEEMQGFEFSRDEYLDRVKLLERGYNVVKQSM